jgi:hypothetical protein
MQLLPAKERGPSRTSQNFRDPSRTSLTFSARRGGSNTGTAGRRVAVTSRRQECHRLRYMESRRQGRSCAKAKTVSQHHHHRLPHRSRPFPLYGMIQSARQSLQVARPNEWGGCQQCQQRQRYMESRRQGRSCAKAKTVSQHHHHRLPHRSRPFPLYGMIQSARQSLQVARPNERGGCQQCQQRQRCMDSHRQRRSRDPRQAPSLEIP